MSEMLIVFKRMSEVLRDHKPISTFKTAWKVGKRFGKKQENVYCGIIVRGKARIRSVLGCSMGCWSYCKSLLLRWSIILARELEEWITAAGMMNLKVDPSSRDVNSFKKARGDIKCRNEEIPGTRTGGGELKVQIVTKCKPVEIQWKFKMMLYLHRQTTSQTKPKEKGSNDVYTVAEEL